MNSTIDVSDPSVASSVNRLFATLDEKPEQEDLALSLRRKSLPIGLGDAELTAAPISNGQYLTFLRELLSLPGIDLGFLINTANPNLPLRRRQGRWMVAPAKVDHPVVGVTWLGAQLFALCCGGRLPTEREWERAAAIDRGIYPWGNDKPNATNANFGHRYGGTTQPGLFGSTGAGFVDLAGNIREWCFEAWDQSAASFGQLNTAVVKGGGWNSRPEALASRSRAEKLAFMGSSSCGFRVLFDSLGDSVDVRPAVELPAEFISWQLERCPNGG